MNLCIKKNSVLSNPAHLPLHSPTKICFPQGWCSQGHLRASPTHRGVKRRCVQQSGHLMLGEEHRAGIQAGLIQLVLHHVPERLEEICEKEVAFAGRGEKSTAFGGENAIGLGKS